MAADTLQIVQDKTVEDMTVQGILAAEAVGRSPAVVREPREGYSPAAVY